ncbi:Dabb family protein [Flavobacterium sp. K77]|uniref:Dabb family protein n=1 Tax=Flavobacterium sp. K77 TaxID=2910676 RepID=UPI001F41E0AE|nr:Dabb family protein [Flavobacterium sp. K77]MCF6139809.1 Dabb family protein [Flavobacterium sp. K77]
MLRRKFIGATTAIGLASLMGLKTKTTSQSVLHQVYFWLKNPDSEADKKQLITGLKTLESIPTVRQIYIGTLASTEKREVVDTSWQVSELLFFENESDQKIYQDHPIHLEFVKKYQHLWEKVRVFDSITQ